MRPQELVAALKVLVAKKRPAFVWGAPGVGKSEIVAQVAAELGMQLVDRRAATFGPTDINGFPVPDTVNEIMKWLPADFLPPMFIDKEVTKKVGRKTVTTIERVPNDTKGIIFLDEMNQALQSIQATLYQLLLDRRAGSYVLPEGWTILGAGNRESDRANAQRMTSALALRLVHLDLEVHVDDWCNWALTQGDAVPTELLSFIRARPTMLHKFDPTQRVSPNPRSWTFCGEMTNSGLNQLTEFEVFKGIVGDGAAIEYRGFLSVHRNMPTVDEIKLNPDKVPVPTTPDVNFALTTALAAATTKDIFPRLMQFVERMGKEWQILYVRDANARLGKNALGGVREYIQWTLKNADFIA